MISVTKGTLEDSDELDAFMTGLSSQLGKFVNSRIHFMCSIYSEFKSLRVLSINCFPFYTVLDKTTRIEGELSILQSELGRILYLLKIADPNGDSAKRRESKILESTPMTTQIIKTTSETKKIYVPEKPPSAAPCPTSIPPKPEESPVDDKKSEGKTQVFSAPKPQWLGAVKEKPRSEEQKKDTASEVVETTDEFVDYRDRKILVDGEGLENAEAGLIIRKGKPTENPEVGKGEGSSEVETVVADAVALLLKHKRGYVAPEDETQGEDEIAQNRKKVKRVLGPEKPSFLEKNSYETWIPPEGEIFLSKFKLYARNIFGKLMLIFFF